MPGSCLPGAKGCSSSSREQITFEGWGSPLESLEQAPCSQMHAMQETTWNVALGMWENNKSTVSASPMLQGLPARLFGTRKELQNITTRLAIILVVGVGFGGFIWFLFCFSVNCKFREAGTQRGSGNRQHSDTCGKVTDETEAEDTWQGTEQRN